MSGLELTLTACEICNLLGKVKEKESFLLYEQGPQHFLSTSPNSLLCNGNRCSDEPSSGPFQYTC